jgi:processive 1,2-diacylglycerol beta-glucosyltransferase
VTIAATDRRNRTRVGPSEPSTLPLTVPMALPSPVRSERPPAGRLTGPGTVHIVSGSYGAGHDAAARELAARFRSRGYRVVNLDIVDMFPARMGRVLRAAYFRQLQALPGTWDRLLHRLEDDGVFYCGVTRALGAAASARLARALATDVLTPTGRASGTGSVLVVSTHPFASQALGHLRLTGRLEVPVATYLTDMSVHPLWIHPGVDMHLALHELPASSARTRGVRAAVVGPLTALHPSRAGDPLAGADRASGRARLGLPEGPRLALVTGGSLGIGELEQSAHDIVATGLATPVVLCGENDGLRARLEAVPGVVALGWRDDVPDLLAVVDCVVQNAGGFTSLEALAAGVPALSYRCLPGHGLTNAQALHDAGWVPWAQTRDDLGDLLSRVLAGRARTLDAAWMHRTGADVVDVLEDLLDAGESVPVPA